MKQWLIITGLILLLLIGGFFVVSKLIMPKAAEAFVPAKWRNIPLGQKRTMVHEYLGAPLTSGNDWEVWRQRLTKSKRYELFIAYGRDSSAKRYLVTYEVEALGYTSVTDVSADSIP